MKKSVVQERVRNIDKNYLHPYYGLEKKLLNEMKMGLLKEAIATLKDIQSFHHAQLAKTNLRSTKNSKIAACTIYTRAAIESGILPEDAFSLSDIFINQIETINTEKRLHSFEFEMVTEFTTLIQQETLLNYAYPISKVVTYIHEHICEKLEVGQLAEIFFISSDHLSRTFTKEVGKPIIQYIHIQKLELAKYYLEHTDMSITDISVMLEFCSTSHFSKVFTKYLHLPPSKWRRKRH